MQQSVLFSHLEGKDIQVRFDEEASSSEGGSVLLKACDHALGLTETLAASLQDPRQSGKITHIFQELLRPRVFGLALGYADGNDAARLKDDPRLKLLTGRDPRAGTDLASQPTLSRFENQVTWRDLARMGEALARTVIERQQRRRKTARLITLDFDPTCDPTHGSQQLSLCNAFYDTDGYLPIVGCLSFDREPEQSLVAALLRDGKAPAKAGLLLVLKRRLPLLREAFPRARLRIRLDAGFAGEEWLAYCESEGLESSVCLASHSVLKREAEPWMELVRQQYEVDEQALEVYEQALVRPRAAVATAQAAGRPPPPAPRPPERPQPQYGPCLYGARVWPSRRRVVIKADRAVAPGKASKDNARFVLTNIQGAPHRLYKRLYCPRGEVENRIKELKAGMQMDRTSCSRFQANQFRLLLAAAGSALLQELRGRARQTQFARAQGERLRLFLWKVGARVQVTVRRIVVPRPLGAPGQAEWRQIAEDFQVAPT